VIGNAQLQQHPSFFDNVKKIVEAKEDVNNQVRLRGGKRSKEENQVVKEGKKKEQCNPDDIKLLDYPQWEAEQGYWIGDYTLLNGDGNAFVSSSWNYPYDHYKGFITGEVSG